MKQLILLAAFALPLFATAQSNFKFGINAGATYADFRGNSFVELNSPRLNFLVGASVELPLNNKLSLYGNLNYERKSIGEKTDYSLTDEWGFTTYHTYNVVYTYNYLTIPVALKYALPKNFYIYGGPFAGIFLGNRITDSGKKVTTTDGLYKTFDFGANAGLGYRLTLNPKNDLNIELRENLGLVSISNQDLVVKTSSLNLIVNWQFTL